MNILFFIALVTGLCIGLFNPFYSLRLEQLGASEYLIGLSSAIYFVCMGVMAILSPRLFKADKLRMMIISGLIICLISALLFLFVQTVTTGFLTRALLGGGLGIYLTSMQTSVLDYATEGQYGKMSALYALCFGLGMGLGPFIATTFYGIDGINSLISGITILSIGILIASIALRKSSNHDDQTNTISNTSSSLDNKLKRITLHGAFAYGVIESVILTIYPIYWIKSGMQLDSLGSALGLVILGGLLFTPLAGWMSDRYGAKRVLFIVALLSLPAISLLTSVESQTWLLVMAFATGATVGPIFAISMALIGQSGSQNKRVEDTSKFTAAFSIGCVVGPLLSGWVMDYFSKDYVFSVSLIVLVAFMINIFKSTNITFKQA